MRMKLKRHQYAVSSGGHLSYPRGPIFVTDLSEGTSNFVQLHTKSEFSERINSIIISPDELEDVIFLLQQMSRGQGL